MNRESRTLSGFFENNVLGPKHVENDGRSHVDRPKVVGFTPYLAGMLKTMIAIC